MSTSKKLPSIEEVESTFPKTLMGSLGIRITRIEQDSVEGEMPVDSRTHQSFGILHGGASVALAETLGSLAASLQVDSEKYHCVGLEINANHIRAMTTGKVKGRATPLHLGRTTQVWEIKITNEDHKLVCVSRFTAAIVPAVSATQGSVTQDSARAASLGKK
jgi:1,4-dihydroxy-2-naphthoyl-CoA hydrolase